MRRIRALLVWTFVLIGILAITPSADAAAYGGPTVTIDVFYNALAPYGDWMNLPPYGWVWWPDVPPGWRPYSEGRWVYSEVGWLWLDDEPWGWAPFHYGRWYLDDSYGWLWVPGEEWAPAWVSWQVGDDWIGWAALPPAARFSFQTGLVPEREFRALVDPSAYVFVEPRFFLRQQVVDVAAPMARNLVLLRRTANVTRYRVDGPGVVINDALPVERVERSAGSRVERFRVTDQPSMAPDRPHVEGDRIEVFRPVVQRVPTARPVVPERPVQPRQQIERLERDRRDLEDRQRQEREALARQQDQMRVQGGERQEETKALEEIQKRQLRVLQTRQKHLQAKPPGRPQEGSKPPEGTRPPEPPKL